MKKYSYVIFAFGVLSLLFLFAQNNTNRTQAIGSSDENAQSIRSQRFEPARKLLRDAGLPFEPDVLLSDNWQERVKADRSFSNSFEMQTTLRTSDKIEGVQIAETVVLPD